MSHILETENIDTKLIICVGLAALSNILIAVWRVNIAIELVAIHGVRNYANAVVLIFDAAALGDLTRNRDRSESDLNMRLLLYTYLG